MHFPDTLHWYCDSWQVSLLARVVASVSVIETAPVVVFSVIVVVFVEVAVVIVVVTMAVVAATVVVGHAIA